MSNKKYTPVTAHVDVVNGNFDLVDIEGAPLDPAAQLIENEKHKGVESVACVLSGQSNPRSEALGPNPFKVC